MFNIHQLFLEMFSKNFGLRRKRVTVPFPAQKYHYNRPHQGRQEIERRRMQIARGIITTN